MQVFIIIIIITIIIIIIIWWSKFCLSWIPLNITVSSLQA